MCHVVVAEVFLMVMQEYVMSLTGIPLNNYMRGKLFEMIAHRKLASGGSFTSWNHETGMFCMSEQRCA